MKIIAYTALHYGVDYLGYAIQSIIDYVDEYYVLYSAIGSHGFRTERPCPDTREDLYAIAQYVAKDKLHWVDGEWAHEGLQRESILKYAPDADVIVVLDSDEIWSETLLYTAQMVGRQKKVHQYRLPIIHYWRSFYRAILHDPAFPIRLICPSVKNGENTLSGVGYINHMGYAQRPAIVEYKQYTHGHRGEWRQDIDWFQERYMANAQQDCHPVGSEYWWPEPVNPADYLPDYMRSHPYWGLEVIE